jgi:hypothetical protein
MRIYVQILFFIIAGSAFVFPQENNRDTLKNIYHYDYLMQLQTKFDEFDMYRELNYMKMDLQANSDSNTIWMWTKLSINNSGNIDFYAGESPGSMLEPIRQQFLENSKLNPVRYVLGIAQTAAVGYLAYRHIKKYGLLK